MLHCASSAPSSFPCSVRDCSRSGTPPRSTKKDLLTLSNLGHFLKGSSAALGVSKVQATCEKIQHYGKLWDDDANVNLSEDAALKKIEPLLQRGKQEYEHAEKWLRDWYAKEGVTGPPNEEE